MSQTILVTGATGRQGGAVARHLLRGGWRVRALTRDPESLGARALSELGMEVVRGDMARKETLLPALEGVYGVFSVQDHGASGAGEEVRQGMNMANAAQETRSPPGPRPGPWRRSGDEGSGFDGSRPSSCPESRATEWRDSIVG